MGKTAYIRLHGRNENAWYSHAESAFHTGEPGDQNGSVRYRYDYSDTELEEFLSIIQSTIKAGKRTTVFLIIIQMVAERRMPGG